MLLLGEVHVLVLGPGPRARCNSQICSCRLQLRPEPVTYSCTAAECSDPVSAGKCWSLRTAYPPTFVPAPSQTFDLPAVP